MKGRTGRVRIAALAAAALWVSAWAMPGRAAAVTISTPARPALEVAMRVAHRSLIAGPMSEMRIATRVGQAHRVARVSALPASGATVCVGSSATCFATIQAAVDAARPGDTIRIGAGTFAGGLTITRSVRLIGAGARSTVIRGGGSVITVGTFGAAVEPTVTISGVTITGGIARSSPESMPIVGVDGVLALGGGVEIPPGADFSGGAAVTISDSVISGNRVAPARTVPSGGALCPNGPCPFALAAGGGIDNWGSLTVANTIVSNNRVGFASGLSSLASDAEGGGVYSPQGSLTMIHASIQNNLAIAFGPNARNANAGGLFAEGGAVSIAFSSVSDNRASLVASLPDSVDMGAVAGGVHIGGGASAVIRGTAIVDNAVSMTNTVGYAVAFSGGLHADPDVVLLNDVISGNTVRSATIGSSSSFAEGDSGAGEIGSQVSGTILSGNSVTVTAANGPAIGFGGASIFRGSFTGSVIADNRVSASSPAGSVYVVGGGLVADFGGISLIDTTVSRNTARGSGISGSVQGGGILDAVTDGPPGGPLSLTRSAVMENFLSASSGVSLAGGGIYSDNVVTLQDSVIANNRPDQCIGC